MFIRFAVRVVRRFFLFARCSNAVACLFLTSGALFVCRCFALHVLCDVGVSHRFVACRL